MFGTRVGRSIRVSSLALLVVALGMGVPLKGHTHHDAIETHVGAQGHGHGVVVVQYEMRLERAVAPVFVARETSLVSIEAPTPLRSGDLPDCDEPSCESRAPPNTGPRAPPL